MGLIAYGLIALAVLGMIGTGVYKVKQWGGDEVRAEWNAANEQARKQEAERSAAAAQALEAERKKRKVVIREVTQYVDKIVDRPIYSNVCIDAAGLSCLESAIRGKVAPGCKPDAAMPAAKPSG